MSFFVDILNSLCYIYIKVGKIDYQRRKGGYDMKFKMNKRVFEILEVEQDKLFNEQKNVNDGKSHYFGMMLPYEQKNIYC